jgi:hypothetical protein
MSCARCGATRKSPSSSANWRKSSPLIGKEAELFEPMNDFASEAAARVTVGKLATLAAAAALEATAPPTVTEAFVRTRVLQQHAGLYGADGLEELAMRVGIIRAGAVGSALALALVMRGAAARSSWSIGRASHEYVV